MIKRILPLTLALCLVCSVAMAIVPLGTYTYGRLVYLSPLSSSTVEYFESMVADMVVSIQETAFSLDVGGQGFQIDRPRYVEETLDAAAQAAFADSLLLLEEGETPMPDTKVTIYDGNMEAASWCLYRAGSALWLAQMAGSAEMPLVMAIYEIIPESRTIYI